MRGETTPAARSRTRARSPRGSSRGSRGSAARGGTRRSPEPASPAAAGDRARSGPGRLEVPRARAARRPATAGEEDAEHDALRMAGEDLERSSTAASAAVARPRTAGSRSRSIAKSAHGHSAMTACSGKSSHGTIVNENPKRTAPKSAALARDAELREPEPRAGERREELHGRRGS